MRTLVISTLVACYCALPVSLKAFRGSMLDEDKFGVEWLVFVDRLCQELKRPVGGCLFLRCSNRFRSSSINAGIENFSPIATSANQKRWPSSGRHNLASVNRTDPLQGLSHAESGNESAGLCCASQPFLFLAYRSQRNTVPNAIQYSIKAFLWGSCFYICLLS